MTTENIKTRASALMNKVETLDTSMATVDGRDGYLKWVADWRSTYAELTVLARDLKRMRRPFLYTYRRPGDNESNPSRS